MWNLVFFDEILLKKCKKAYHRSEAGYGAACQTLGQNKKIWYIKRAKIDAPNANFEQKWRKSYHFDDNFANFVQHGAEIACISLSWRTIFAVAATGWSFGRHPFIRAFSFVKFWWLSNYFFMLSYFWLYFIITMRMNFFVRCYVFRFVRMNFFGVLTFGLNSVAKNENQKFKMKIKNSRWLIVAPILHE